MTLWARMSLGPEVIRRAFVTSDLLPRKWNWKKRAVVCGRRHIRHMKKHLPTSKDSNYGHNVPQVSRNNELPTAEAVRKDHL